MTCADLRSAFVAALDDPEYERLGAGLVATVRFVCDGEAFALRLDEGRPALATENESADLTIEAGDDAWRPMLAKPPAATFHAFTAICLANPAFAVSGDPQKLAQARPLLERMFERVAACPQAASIAVTRDLGAVSGVWRTIRCGDEAFEIFVERSGHSGPPILFLHTAGADARQFQAQISDVELAGRWRMFAPDLPFHGRSMPPLDWNGAAYRLTSKTYLDWCVAIIEQVIGEPVVVVGGSMGAAMTMTLAAKRPDLVLGAIAIEPPFRSKGRRNPYQHHVGVNAGLHNSSFVRGLMSPTSPEALRRRAAWIYSQGAPQVYTGDLAFYSEEFDGGEIAPRIDEQQTPVALLCGAYDYSATPEDGRKLAELIPGARLSVMPGLGHFPMCEHPDLFRPYFIDALSHVTRS